MDPTVNEYGVVATCSRYAGGFYGFTLQGDYSLVGTQQGPVDEVFPFSSHPIQNQWNHLAFVKNGGILTMYINGNSVGTISSTLSQNSNDLVIGMISPDQISYQFTGYMDQVRVTKVARYVTNFTPPTSEFPVQ